VGGEVSGLSVFGDVCLEVAAAGPAAPVELTSDRLPLTLTTGQRLMVLSGFHCTESGARSLVPSSRLQQALNWTEKSMAGMETELVRQWVERAVLGLGLCPFAGEHWQAGRVRLTVSPAVNERDLLEDLRVEIAALAATDSTRLETTLLIVPHLLQDFGTYNQFLDRTDILISEHGWTGRFQIASFHPDYQFTGTMPDDPGNLTNRSPFPLLHVLRESTISQALSEHPDPDQIPLTNVATLRALSEERRQEIFQTPQQT